MLYNILLCDNITYKIHWSYLRSITTVECGSRIIYARLVCRTNEFDEFRSTEMHSHKEYHSPSYRYDIIGWVASGAQSPALTFDLTRLVWPSYSMILATGNMIRFNKYLNIECFMIARLKCPRLSHKGASSSRCCRYKAAAMPKNFDEKIKEFRR